MIVDDVETNLLVLKSLVQAAGTAAVETYLDPVAALSALPVFRPQMILVDYMMPGLDGISFIRRVREDPAFENTPIVMVTTSDERAVRVEALQAGATDFLQKPIDPVEFKARFRNLMQLAQAQDQLRDRAAWLAQEVDKALELARSRELEVLSRLARAAELRDPETGHHIERMARYSEAIAEAMGLEPHFCASLRLAAPMHDIGKIGIPDSILLKEGPLTDAERDVMQTHTERGGEILGRSTSDLIRLAGEIAMSHHERYDGKGYPRGLSGEAIPLSGRITAVADVFDALTAVRPYKRAWTLDETKAHLIAGKGQHFDPKCIDAMVAAWPRIITIMRDYASEVAAA